MKSKPAKIMAVKKKKQSEALKEETENMEKQLQNLQEFMVKHKEKIGESNGRVWSSTNKPISNYANFVMTKKKGLISAEKRQKQKVDSKETEKLGILPKVEDSKESQSTADMSKKIIEKLESNTPQIDAFLKRLNLDKYKSAFIKSGIEDLETLLEMEEKHFDEMNIPTGHKLIMLREIKKLRNNVDQQKVSKKNNSIMKNSDNTNSNIDKNKDLELQLLEEQSHKEFLAARTAFLQSIHKEKANIEIQENENESESKKENENSNSNLNSNLPIKNKKNVRFSEEVNVKLIDKEIGAETDSNSNPNQNQNTEKKPKFSLTGLANQDWNPVSVEIPVFEEAFTETNEEKNLKAKNKNICYHCMKLSVTASQKQKFGKEFCSDKCLNEFCIEGLTQCKTCGNEFEKGLGALVGNNWYCTAKCVPEINQEITPSVNQKTSDALTLNKTNIKAATKTKPETKTKSAKEESEVKFEPYSINEFNPSNLELNETEVEKYTEDLLQLEL